MRTAYYINRSWLLLLIGIFFISLPVKTISQSRSIIDSLENILKNAKEDTSKVNLLNKLGYAYQMKSPEKVLQYENEAIILAEKCNFKKGAANAYGHIALMNINQGNHSDALKNFNHALTIFEKLGYKKQIGDVYGYIGIVNKIMGDYSEGLKNEMKSMAVSEEIGYKEGMAKTYVNIGIIYFEQGNYPYALKNYLAASRLFEELKDQNALGIVYNNIGCIYLDQGNYSEALKNYLAALKSAEETGDKRRMAYAYGSISISYKEQGNYSESLRILLTILNLLEEEGDQKGLALAYLNIGDVYFLMGNSPEALNNLQSGLRVSEQIGDKKAIGDSYYRIGLVYLQLGKFTESLNNIQTAIKICEEIGDKTNLSNAYHDIGNVLIDQANVENPYEATQKYKEALQYTNRGLLLAFETGEKKLIMNSYRNLAFIDSALNNYKEALVHFKLYSLYKDSLYNGEKTKQVDQLKIQYETEKKDKEIELLNKESRINALQMERQKVSLLAANLDLDNKRNELLLLNKSNELQQLQLVKTQEDRDHQLLVVKAKTARMELIKKEKELKVQQLKEQKLLRNGILAGTVLLLLLGLFLFRSLYLRKKLEKQKAIIQERKRISADLHDDIGSGLSKISLLSEMVKQQARSTEARIEAEKIAKIARELLDSIREIIWALNANNDYLENLVSFIRKNAAEYFENSSVKLRIETPLNIPQMSISGEYRRNVFYSVKEAMHNIVKHSGATEAEVKFTIEDDVFSISIKDNGKGFPEGELNRFGNGIKNIMSRMEIIHGNVTIENHVGTKITLALPV